MTFRSGWPVTMRALTIAGVVAAAMGGLRLSAQQGPVRVFLSAADTTGLPYTNLRASDVIFLLDGIPCTTTKLEPVNWPMKLFVLVDNGSVLEPAQLLVREGLREFFNELPEEIETSLTVYSPVPRTLVPPTHDHQALIKGVDLLAANPGGGAMFFEVVNETVNRISRERGNFFYTIMILTTNGSEGSSASVAGITQRLKDQLTARPVTVHAIMAALSQSSGPITGGSQMQVSDALASMTGGRYESVNVPNALVRLLPEFGRQIARSDLMQRHQYRMSCDRSPSANPKISVSARNPRVTSLSASFDGRIP